MAIDPSLKPVYTARVKELKSLGMTAKKAREIATQECEAAMAGDDKMSDHEWEEKLQAQSTDSWKDIVWVYDNISLEKPDMATCPSQGAKGLLKWAKQDAKSFYAEYFKMLAKRDVDHSEDDLKHDARRQSDEIDRMLDAILPACT